MSKIIPNLWFDSQAEEAAHFYVTTFTSSGKKARVTKTTEYGPSAAQAAGRPEGSVMTAEFELDGQQFIALNGGPVFKFTPAISLMVICKTQAEIDSLWEQLSEGGKKEQCGWLTDKYGVSWQITPAILGPLLAEKDAKATEKVMRTMLKMQKLDIGLLKEAAEEEEPVA